MTILVVMLLAALLAVYMALPAVAGLLIQAAWNMTKPHKWRVYMADRISDRVLLVLTVIGVAVAQAGRAGIGPDAARALTGAAYQTLEGAGGAD